MILPILYLGLPRIMSTEEMRMICAKQLHHPANGFCFCTGSFGVRPDNDLPGMVKRLGDHIHFLHLRSTKRDSEGNFFEADHLDGDVDMYAVVKEIVACTETPQYFYSYASRSWAPDAG
jgi:mannonate dehydratase